MTLSYIKKKLPPVDKLVSFEPPNTKLKASAVHEIKSTLESYAGIRIPLNTSVKWVAQDAEGSLLKRLKKYLYQKHKIKLADEQWSILGNLINKHIPKPKMYSLDVTQTFDWSQGDFGDHEACFLRSQSSKRYGMNDDGEKRFYALRIFKKSQKDAQGSNKYYRGYHGVSRSWFWRVPVDDGMVLVLINGYGLTTIQQASLLSAYLGKPFRVVGVTNSKNAVNGLYANDGIGYAIGDSKYLNKLKIVDISTK